MITKEQFYSIQFNKGKFYFVNWHKNEVVEQDYLKATLFCDIDNEVVHFRNNDNELIWKIKLDNLFETKEDAEWELEFSNITRTETLSLPTWEEFCGCKCSNEFTFFANGFEYNLFATVRNKECGEPDTLIIGINNLKMACGYDEIFEKPLTKETYIEACKLAKKLFLGEEVE